MMMKKVMQSVLVMMVSAVVFVFMISPLRHVHSQSVDAEKEAKAPKTSQAAEFSLSQQGSQAVYTLYGKAYTLSDLKKLYPLEIHEVENSVFSQLQKLMQRHWMTLYFERKAKADGITVEQAESQFAQEYEKVQEADIKALLKQMESMPQMQGKSEFEKRKQATSFLQSQKKNYLLQTMMMEAQKNGTMVMASVAPKKPRVNVVIYEDDYVRYGPRPEDTKPLGCEGSKCPVTIVEFSEYQCPYCARAVNAGVEIMKKYQGKVRWVMKDFPLDFHDRAKPAAVMAACANEQGRYWHAYFKLFEHQRDLSDKTFVKIAKDLGIYNTKFKDCLVKPDTHMARIERSLKEAVGYGISGTPAFFVNGEFFSGVQSVERLSAIIDAEL